MYDKDEIKNNLTIEQITELVLACGASSPTVRPNMIMIENICHNPPGESKKQRLWYYDNTKLFRCYTDCGDVFDVFDLVIKVRRIQHNEDWTMFQSIRFVAQFFGISPKEIGFANDVDEGVSSVLSFLSKFEHHTEQVEAFAHQELKVYDDKLLNNLSKTYCGDWLREGISKEAMQKFNIRYYPVGEKIVIPHYSEFGDLIGIRGRALVKEEAELYGKYTPLRMNGIMYNHPLSFALYGLYENQSNIKNLKKAIIFEGEKSVLLFESLFGSDSNIAVASCGSNISSHQIELLLELGVEEVTIAFDRQFKEIGDKEFQNHKRNLMKLVSKFEKRCKVSIMFDKWNLLDYKDAPIDKGKDTFMSLYSRRIYI